MEVDNSEFAERGKERKDRKVRIIEVPISKGVRPWRTPRSYPASSVKNRTVKTSWERKERLRQKKRAIQEMARAARKADAAAKEAERKRRAERKKRKEENEQRSTKKQVITNPKTIKNMSKKAFLYLVRN